jgi:hypothetical protein
LLRTDDPSTRHIQEAAGWMDFSNQWGYRTIVLKIAEFGKGVTSGFVRNSHILERKWFNPP